MVVLKHHRRLWANIFDTYISRCINTYIKMVYLAFFGIFMLLQMSVSKILAHRCLWCFKTTKSLQKWLQTWFILLHLVLVWNVRVKSIWTHSAGVPWQPQILADQLTLSQPGGQIMPTYLLMAPPNFQTFRRPCRSTTTTNKDQIGSVRNTRCSECLQIYSL